MNKWVKSVVASALSCMILAGCSSKPSTDKNETNNGGTKTEGIANPAKARNTKDNLVVGGNTTAIKGQFLPIFQDTAADGSPMALMFRGLLMSNEDGKYVPDVAESMEISEDKLTYTFKLRDDVKFHDGTPVTAEDVEFTFLASADPTYDGWHNDAVLQTVGYEEYNGDKDNKVNKMEGIKVIDEKTISFTFKEVLRNVDEFLALGIMPKHVYDKGKGNLAETRKIMDEGKFVGNGPYKLAKYEPKQFVEFDANKDFYLGAPKISKVIIKNVPRESCASELNIGEVDVYPSYPTKQDDIALIQDKDFLDIEKYEGVGFSYVGFNLENPKFKDKEVRQALNYALDKEAFVKSYFNEYATVATNPYPTGSWASTKELLAKLNKYEYNPEKANEMLDKAGWKRGADGIREKDGVKLEITHLAYTESKYIETFLPILKSNWEAIGAKVETQLMEFGVLTDTVGKALDGNGKPAFDTFNMGWQLGGFDPNAVNWVFRSEFAVDDGTNKTRYVNPEVDKLFDKGLKEFDEKKLQEIYGDIAVTLNEDCPVIFTDCASTVDVINKRVKNWDASATVGWTSIIHKVEIAE